SAGGVPVDGPLSVPSGGVRPSSLITSRTAQIDKTSNATIQANTTQKRILSSIALFSHSDALNLFRRAQGVPPVFPRVGERKREGVGGVGRGRRGQRQQTLHHVGYRQLLRCAIADDGLLHFARSDFV